MGELAIAGVYFSGSEGPKMRFRPVRAPTKAELTLHLLFLGQSGFPGRISKELLIRDSEVAVKVNSRGFPEFYSFNMTIDHRPNFAAAGQFLC
jgi:hypothetical protein